MPSSNCAVLPSLHAACDRDLTGAQVPSVAIANRHREDESGAFSRLELDFFRRGDDLEAIFAAERAESAPGEAEIASAAVAMTVGESAVSQA